MTYEQYIEQSQSFKNQIEARAFEYLEKVETQILKDPFEYLLKGGGKRIRPILVLVACGIAGGDTDEAVDMALSMEILHNFTLVHDDIMDSSPIRRGRETIHVKWGVPIGVLVGDLMIGYACKLMPKKSIDNIFAVQKLFNDSLIEVCEGQALDIEFNEREDISEEDYFRMIYKKTSFLLLSSLQIGALIGGGDEHLISTLKSIGEDIGIGFQLQDDLLDLTANNPKFGKVKGQDLIEGKKTYMIIKTKELAKETHHKQLIEEFYKNNGANEESIPAITEMMQELGVFDMSRQLSDRYFNQAKSNIAQLPNNQYREMLEFILEDLIIRTH